MGEPTTETRRALVEVGCGAELVVGVGDAGVARAVVDGGDAERAEPRHVGPAVLRPCGLPDRGDELLGQREVEARPMLFLYIWIAAVAGDKRLRRHGAE